jgi:L-Ala-D/L-Glu epimerase
MLNGTRQENRMFELVARAADFARVAPFVIAKWTKTVNHNVAVTLAAGGVVGHGEATGNYMIGETQESVLADLRKAAARLRGGMDPAAVCAALEPGGARNVLDAALWDWRAKHSRTSVVQLLGLAPLMPKESTDTIGIGAPQAMAAAAAASDHGILKLKLDRELPLERLRAVRAARPDARLLVDANEAWTLALLNQLAPELAALGVGMIEQPLPAAQDSQLEGYTGSIPLAADESFAVPGDVPALKGRYTFANIKLDKCGGLSAALQCFESLISAGIRPMVGCMGGSTLANAPAFIIAQRCDCVDLDSSKPLIDPARPELIFEQGWVRPAATARWGQVDD